MTVRPGRPEQIGRPLHPPLTDFPVAAYIFAAAFDVISAIGGQRHGWARQFWHAGTFVLIGGACICVLTVLTGFRDLLRFPAAGKAVNRPVTMHVCVMVVVFMIGISDIAWRLRDYGTASTPAGILVLSLVAAGGVSVGAAYGGTLVFRYGTGVAADADARAAAQPGTLARLVRTQPGRPPAADGIGRTARRRARRARWPG